MLETSVCSRVWGVELAQNCINGNWRFNILNCFKSNAQNLTCSESDHLVCNRIKMQFFFLFPIAFCPDLMWPGARGEVCSGWIMSTLLYGHNPLTTLAFEGAVTGHECKVSSWAFPAVGPLGAFTEEQRASDLAKDRGWKEELVAGRKSVEKGKVQWEGGEGSQRDGLRDAFINVPWWHIKISQTFRHTSNG